MHHGSSFIDPYREKYNGKCGFEIGLTKKNYYIFWADKRVKVHATSSIPFLLAHTLNQRLSCVYMGWVQYMHADTSNKLIC